MAKKTYLPRTEAGRRQFLNNAADKLPGAYATKYGITADELSALGNFRLWFNWALDALAHIRERSQGYTQFRDALAYGKGGATGNLTPPPAFALAAVPTVGGNPITPVADGFGLVSSLVSRIKDHRAYTLADGEDLDIEGAEEAAPDPETTKPDIKAVTVTGGRVEIRWKKQGFTGVRIEVDRGDGPGWRFLAVDTEPDYVDTVLPAAGAVALWKYRALYLQGDEPFGQWSDGAETTVRG